MPFDKVNNSGIVYVWIGSKSDEDEAKLAEEIANKLYDTVSMITSSKVIANLFILIYSKIFFFNFVIKDLYHL